jgi:hypothetical protein
MTETFSAYLLYLSVYIPFFSVRFLVVASEFLAGGVF